jgi:hypothetical protein
MVAVPSAAATDHEACPRAGQRGGAPPPLSVRGQTSPAEAGVEPRMSTAEAARYCGFCSPSGLLNAFRRGGCTQWAAARHRPIHLEA